MTKPNTGALLNRYNVLLSDQESAWLDALAEEIHTSNGAKVSRSEIIRAAIAGLRELHRLAPDSWFPNFTTARSGGDLAILAVLAARCAARERP